jgi:hypothetical protein
MTNHKPTASQVRRFLRDNGLTGKQAAHQMYVSSDRAIRKYTQQIEPHQMDGSKWFCLHAHKLLSAEQIAEIEAAIGEYK